jgi:hypothetical protein
MLSSVRHRQYLLVLLLCACGGDPSRTDPDAEAEVPDAPDHDGPGTPACQPSASGGCRECVIGGARPIGTSLCTEAVCAVDARCCEDAWTERCTELADAVCPEAACVDAITIAGDGEVSMAWRDGDGFAGDVYNVASALRVQAIEWADGLDDDGDADLIFAGACHAFVRQNLGWDGDRLQLGAAITHEAFPDCGGDTWWYGRRARWADADNDGDLDAFFAGVGGAFWMRASAGELAYAGEIIPASEGQLYDLLITDLDDDGDADAVAGFFDAPVRAYHQVDDDAPWVAGEIFLDAVEVTLELCQLRATTGPIVVIGGYGGTHAFHLDGAPVFPEGSEVPNSTTSFDVACGDLDGDRDEELVIATAEVEPRIKIADYPDGVIWSSFDDLEPDFSATVFGVDVGDLDGDGDGDVVAQTAGEGFVVLDNQSAGEALVFTLQDGIDVVPGSEAYRVEMVRLGTP